MGQIKPMSCQTVSFDVHSCPPASVPSVLWFFTGNQLMPLKLTHDLLLFAQPPALGMATVASMKGDGSSSDSQASGLTLTVPPCL